jgi:hypothetical protein
MAQQQLQVTRALHETLMPRKVWLCFLTALIFLVVGREIKGDLKLTLSSLSDISSWVSNKTTSLSETTATLRDPNLGSEEALQFVHGRRKLYESKNISRRWKMRGIGNLYSFRNMV